MRRRLLILAGLLCVLLHAGLSAWHQGMPAAVAHPLVQDAAAAGPLADLEAALVASMCRPSTAGKQSSPEGPSAPADHSLPCLACNCPGAMHALAVVAMVDRLPVRLGLSHGLVWRVWASAARDRTSLRPPVRGPPLRHVVWPLVVAA